MPTTHFYTIDLIEANAAVANMGASPEGIAFWAFTQNSSTRIPMYQLYYPLKETFLYTTFIDERDVAVNEQGYQADRIGFWCLPVDDSEDSGIQPLFRLYNPTSQDHLYTIDPDETPDDYNSEGIACMVFKNPAEGTVALNRFSNGDGIHYYSTSVDVPEGYHLEGQCGNVFDNGGGGLVPLFRSYNPGTGGHLYTADIAEHDNASNDYGYRGDGIACYVFNNADQVAGTVEVLRAYKATTDDHFYTISSMEFNSLGLDWSREDPTNIWVFAHETRSNYGHTEAVQRFSGDFVDDFLLLPPGLPEFLSSNSNFFMTSQVGAGTNPILGLDVEVAITSDLTISSVDSGDLGFSLQLNAVAPPYYTSAWQQYCIVVSQGVISFEIQNHARSELDIGFMTGGGNLCKIDGNTLSAGYSLRIKLMNDAYSNIIGADFYVLKGKHQVGHKQLLIKNIKNASLFGSAPIVVFQLLLVGNGSGANSTFAGGGAGLITYNADVPLVATYQLPTLAETGNETAEMSNCTYGEIAATKSKMLTQTFGVD